MNNEQYKRFCKIRSEHIECLFKTHDKQKQLHFLISGSSGTRYKVTIGKTSNGGSINCSCPDFKNGAKINECVCKHCLFVLFEELKIIRDIDHPFFKRCFFTPDEIERVYSIYKASLKK